MSKGKAGSSEVARLAYHVMRDGAALALMSDDSPTRLKGTPGNSKRVAWCDPLPLDEVRAVSKALHCSINDVLLACVAGAMVEYLRNHGDSVSGKEIPVSYTHLDVYKRQDLCIKWASSPCK